MKNISFRFSIRHLVFFILFCLSVGPIIRLFMGFANPENLSSIFVIYFKFVLIIILMFLMYQLFFAKSNIVFTIRNILLLIIIMQIFDFSEDMTVTMVQVILMAFMLDSFLQLAIMLIQSLIKNIFNFVQFNYIILDIFLIVLGLVMKKLYFNDTNFLEYLIGFSQFLIALNLAMYFIRYKSVVKNDDEYYITLNSYKPKLYNTFMYDTEDSNFIFFNKKVKQVDGYTRSKCLDKGDTLIQLEPITRDRKFSFILKSMNENGKPEYLDVHLDIKTTQSGEVYLKDYKLYRYYFISKLIVKVYLLISNKINKFSCRMKISDEELVHLMLKNNLYFDDDMFVSLDKLSCNKGANFGYIDSDYGNGKTTFALEYINRARMKPEHFSYSNFKYDDILAEILNKLLGKINMGTYLIVLAVIAVVGAITRFFSVFFGDFAEYFKGSQYYSWIKYMVSSVLDDLKMSDEIINVYITFVLIVLVIALVVLFRNKVVFNLINFGSSRSSDVLCSKVSSLLVENKSMLVIDDIDREKDFDKIYNELKSISYIYKVRGGQLAGIISFSTTNIIKKIKKEKQEYEKDAMCVKRENPTIKCCRYCRNSDHCDFFQLLKKYFVKKEYDYEKSYEKYIEALKEMYENKIISKELFDICRRQNSYRDLKIGINEYLNS